jgi:hypothetical protein
LKGNPESRILNPRDEARGEMKISTCRLYCAVRTVWYSMACTAWFSRFGAPRSIWRSGEVSLAQVACLGGQVCAPLSGGTPARQDATGAGFQGRWAGRGVGFLRSERALPCACPGPSAAPSTVADA